jgi:hypothetical protein
VEDFDSMALSKDQRKGESSMEEGLFEALFESF